MMKCKVTQQKCEVFIIQRPEIWCLLISEMFLLCICDAWIGFLIMCRSCNKSIDSFLIDGLNITVAEEIQNTLRLFSLIVSLSARNSICSEKLLITVWLRLIKGLWIVQVCWSVWAFVIIKGFLVFWRSSRCSDETEEQKCAFQSIEITVRPNHKIS